MCRHEGIIAQKNLVTSANERTSFFDPDCDKRAMTDFAGEGIFEGIGN